jgi:DNA-binding phage protein
MKRPPTEAAVRILKIDDVISLLRAEIKRAGTIGAWAEKAGINRAVVSKVLSKDRPPTKGILRALKLRTVIVADK